jgi:dihydrofolate reductase
MENNIADVLDITLVHHEFEADVFFPEIDLKIWKEVSREDFKADEKNKFNYSFLKFQKKTN